MPTYANFRCARFQNRQTKNRTQSCNGYFRKKNQPHPVIGHLNSNLTMCLFQVYLYRHRKEAQMHPSKTKWSLWTHKYKRYLCDLFIYIENSPNGAGLRLLECSFRTGRTCMMIYYLRPREIKRAKEMANEMGKRLDVNFTRNGTMAY